MKLSQIGQGKAFKIDGTIYRPSFLSGGGGIIEAICVKKSGKKGRKTKNNEIGMGNKLKGDQKWKVHSQLCTPLVDFVSWRLGPSRLLRLEYLERLPR